MNRFLEYLRFEEDGKLSLTNLSVYVLLASMILRPLDLAQAAAFLVAAVSYGHKRYVNSQKEQADNAQDALEALQVTEAAVKPLRETLASLANDVAKVSIAIGLGKK